MTQQERDRSSVAAQVRRSFRLVAAAVLLLVLGITGCGAFVLGQVQPSLHRAVLAGREVREAHTNMLDQETGVRGYLLSRPGAARSFLQPYFAGVDLANVQFDLAARDLTGDTAAERQLHDTRAAAARWQQQWVTPVLTRRAVSDPQSFLLTGKRLFDSYRQKETALVAALTERTDEHLRMQKAALLGLLAFAAVVGLATLAAVVIMQRRLTRQIVVPVRRLAGAVQAVRDGTDTGLDDAAYGERLATGKAPAELRELWAVVAEMRTAVGARAAAAEDELAELLSLSEIDALTGLFNRRRFDADLARAFEDASTPVSVIAVDVDRFKQVNDTRGHAGGDEVLKRVAQLLARAARTDDRVYRFGGEEFVVLLATADSTGAERVAQRLRSAVAGGTDVTVSCGVATRRPGDDAQTALRRADAALYAAKRAGRNRVCAASSPRARPR